MISLLFWTGGGGAKRRLASKSSALGPPESSCDVTRSGKLFANRKLFHYAYSHLSFDTEVTGPQSELIRQDLIRTNIQQGPNQ